ncbi:MAG: InlB B-repeat-containing protein, partial [Lachnospiraceae bacterium]|nr:InlB B-repeat-containing protein [Lachnospiraceae bacterium]
GYEGNLGYAQLTGEHVFLLDAVEATRPSYGYANTEGADASRFKSGTSTYWWLRSPSSSNNGEAGGVYPSGDIGNYFVDSSYGVSPAFNLKLSSVILSSEVSDGYKLTVKDENMTIAKTDGSDVTREGNVITVPYTISGTNAANATQVSVLLTNSAYIAGETRTSGYSYQKLNVTTLGTSGTGTFTIPDAYKNKICGTDYHAYILAEDVNTGNATDYASIPVEITIPGKPVLTITAKDKTYPYNGEMQGPGDTTYEDPTEIAEMVTVEGLQSGDTLTSITVDGQGKDVRDYDLIPYAAVINNNISASTKYDVTYVKGTLHITSTGKSYTVTFKVKNGEWNDGKKADKTVTLSGNAGDTLKLSADQIPAVGSKPDTHCKEGSWDVTPDTKTVITSDTTYTYTYVNDGPQPEECTITFKANGGKGEMKPQSGDKGETIKLRANDFTRSGYEFRNWNTKADGSGDKYDNKQSIELTKDMTLYAQWKEKDDDDDDDDHEEEPAPKKDVRYPDGFDELRGLLSKAISDANSSGLVQTVTWNKSTSLPADVMKILHDNPNVTLVFSYTYLGTSITLTIPGSAVVLNPAVEWYGPAYLFGLYGKGETAALTTNTTVSARTYTVKSGDTLSGIAKRLKTTVKHLKDANNIKDVDKIKPGMVLKY